MSRDKNEKTIKQSAVISLVLHVSLFSLMWVCRSEFRTWTPSPSVYQVELVSVARSAASSPKIVEQPAPQPEPEPEPVEAVSPKVPPPKKKEAPKKEKKRSVKKKKPVQKPENPEKKPAEAAPPEPAVATADSAVSGSNRMKIEIPNFPFAYYLNILKFRIQENWQPPPGRRERRNAVVGFVISRQGKISNVVLETSSGKYHFDQAAQRAVYYANPLPPLPADFLEDFLSVHIEFEGL